MINSNKRIVICICTILLLMFSLSSCSKKAEIAVTPCFYKVSDDNSSVYILGSFHIGKMSIYPLPQEIMSAYNKCETVMFEVGFNTVPAENYDISREDTEALIGKETAEQAVAAIKAEYPNMERRAKKAYPAINMENINQAGYHTLQGLLSLAASTKAGLIAECGIDQTFISYALRDHKNIIGAETWEEQYSLTYDLPADAHKAIMNEYIAVEEMEKRLNNEFEMWCKGDANGIDKIEVSPLRQADKNSWQHVQYENLLTRNKHMQDKVIQQLEKDETTFVLFGAAHIVGEDGVIRQLQEMNYSVEPVHFN